jgi:hypothetical protein
MHQNGTLLENLESDIQIDTSAFAPESIDPRTLELNQRLMKACKEDTKWWTVSRYCLHQAFFATQDNSAGGPFSISDDPFEIVRCC